MAKIRQTVNIKKNSFEMAAWQQEQVVVGIDEVGRGCLAGPVVAAAVILPINKASRLLKDSKLMTAVERQAAFVWIKKHCFYGVGIAHHRLIDQHNIRQATFIAMKRALLNVLESSRMSPSAVLVDAMPLNLSDTAFFDIPVHHFNYGETRSSSIAAASIVAKITRDAMMELFDAALPGYVWAENKGYGTAAHKAALQKQNRSIVHRLSFLNKLLCEEDGPFFAKASAGRHGDMQLSFDSLAL
jgi:ribonuclease HII